jgi:hypothetical protein
MKGAPPLIRWRSGDQLTCTDPHSGKAGFWIPDLKEGRVCREGLTMSFLECFVSWHGESSFADTALPEELLHVAYLRRGIWQDHHAIPAFFEEIARAGAALREAGR